MDKVSRCGGLDNDALVEYVYGECEPPGLERVEAHLAACGRCAAEVAALRAARRALPAWEAPRPAAGVRIVSERDARRGARWSFALRPAWGLAAAAGLVLGVGLALVGVDVRLVEGGFVMRVGNTARPDAEVAPAAAASGALPGLPTVAAPPAGNAPWRADLALLESELRRDLAADSAAAPAADREALLERVRGLISQSERRQQQERALWLTEFAQELDMQRRADQQQFQQELGALEGFADYLVRVSQR